MQDKKTKKKMSTNTKKKTKSIKKTTTNIKNSSTNRKNNTNSGKRVISGKKKKRKNKKKMDLKRKILIIGSILFVMFLIFLGSSYALVSTSIKGKKTNFIKTSTYNVFFDDGSEYINLTNEGPESDEEGLKNNSYKFTVVNDGNINVENKIYFSDIESTIPNKYLKIAIKENGTYIVKGKTLEEVTSVIRSSMILKPGDSVTYEIVFWISSAADNSIMNTTYKSKITIESNQTNKNPTILLPLGYTGVQYIESTGSQCIETGMLPRNNLTVYMDFQLTSLEASGSNRYLLAYYYDSHRYRPLKLLNSKFYIQKMAGANNAKIINADLNRHTIIFNNTQGKVIWDEEDCGSVYNSINPPNEVGLGVFCQTQYKDSSINYANDSTVSMKLYDLIGYEKNTQKEIWHGVPVLDDNGKPGLYDLISGQTYYDMVGNEELLYGDVLE